MVVSCFGPAEKAKRRRRRKNILSRSVDLSPGKEQKRETSQYCHSQAA